VASGTNTLGSYAISSSTALVGGYVYLGNVSGANGLYVFDPTGPSSTPTWSDTTRVPTGFAFSGTTLFVSSSSGYLDTYDVSTPAAPAHLGQVALSGLDVAYANGFAYVATGTGLAIVSVATPASPTLIITKTLTDLGIPSDQQPKAVTISGAKLVLTTTDGAQRNRFFVYLLQ
jgi:hypothetical protein